MRWKTTRFDLDLSSPLVMGIVNITPDSFSDGGHHQHLNAALQHAERLLKDGADILDVGGESTRPGAEPLSLAQELARVLPFVQEAVRWQVPISVDTYKPEVMQAVLDMGVDIINDVWALRQPGAEQVIAGHGGCGVCLMHMQGDPKTMQTKLMSGDVLIEVAAFLSERSQALLDSGVDSQRLLLDAGIGFGKSIEQNFQLLARQAELLRLGFPLLAGWSRKSSLGHVLAIDGHVPEPQQRQVASVAAAVLAVDRGASVVRVHDVKETVEALKVWRAMSAQLRPI